MKPQKHFSFLFANALALSLFVLSLAAHGDPVELSSTPISSAASTQVKPNILFVMDDSLSMELDYLPDWAGGSKPSWLTTAEAAVHYDYPRRLYQTRNPDFNGVTYNPEVSYVPPKYFNASGELDETAYPSQDRAETHGWTAVKNDGYGVQYLPDNTMDLNGLAFYYTTVPGEYCTDRTLRKCIATTAPTTSGGVEYKVPAKLRWCQSAQQAALTTPTAGYCGAIEIDGTKALATSTSYSNTPYSWARMPMPRMNVIYFSGTTSTTVSSVKVPVKMDDGTVMTREILSGTTAATTSANDVAQQVAAQINECSFSLVGNCQVVGHRAEAMYYSATLGFVYILMPRDPGSTAAATAAPVLAGTGMASTNYRYGTASSITSNLVYASSSRPVDLFYQGYTTASASYTVPGDNVLTVITPSRTRYPKAESRVDCAGADCTYDEEMTNFANWWAYYRTRMQAMKTAASRSFEPIDDRFRIGYYSINNNTESDFRNISEFDGAQKHEWYKKLFDATPYRTDDVTADTPLRVALSQAGHLFAGLPGSAEKKMNGVDAVDPMQHFCQANYTILSTDGYWNLGAGFKLDNTPVGEQDGYVNDMPLEVRPMLDGGISKFHKYRIQQKTILNPSRPTWNQSRTSRWKKKIEGEIQRSDFVPQFRTSQLQQKEAHWYRQDWRLDKREKNVYQRYGKYQHRQNEQKLTETTGPVQTRKGKLQKRTKDQIMRRNGQLHERYVNWEYRLRDLQRQYSWVQERTSTNGGVTWSATWDNVESCTPVTSGNNLRQCRLSAASGWVNVAADPYAGLIAGNTSAQCKTVAGGTVTTGQGTDNETTTYTTTVGCQYTNPAYLKVEPEGTVCTGALAVSPSSPFTVTQAKECRTNGYRGNFSPVTTGSCDYVANLRECTYVYDAAVADDDCPNIAVPPSPGPSYTERNPITCSSDGWTGWRDVGDADHPSETSCNAVANSVECRYDWPATWAPEVSGGYCDTTTLTPDYSSSPNYTVLTGTDCRVDWTTTANKDSCTIHTSGLTRASCAYQGPSGWSGWSSDTCNARVPDTNSSDGATLYVARQCETQGVKSSLIVDPTCDPSSVSFDSSKCTAEWAGWVEDVPSCLAGGDPAIECKYTLLGSGDGWYPVTTCPTPVPKTTGNVLWVGPAHYCDARFVAGEADWKDASSCVDDVDTDCRYKDWTEWDKWAIAAPCTAVARSSGASQPDGIHFDVDTARECKTDWTAYTPDPDCRDDEAPGVTNCQIVGEDWVNVPYDPDSPPSDGSVYQLFEDSPWTPPIASLPTATLDNPSPSLACTEGINVSTGVVTYCQGNVPNSSGVIYTSECIPVSAESAANGVEILCYDPGSPDGDPPIPPKNTQLAPNVWDDGITTACTKVLPVGPNFIETVCDPVGGTSTPDTLADVAEYYWKTDLRTSVLGNCQGGPATTNGVTSTNDVCPNTDTILRQNMKTFTLGLGASGVMQFQPDYGKYTDPGMETLVNPIEGGDMYSITMGVEAKPTEGICSWQTANGPCNWPKPASNQQTNIDDLWHAAINGRGTYFSAENPSAMAAGISAALQEVLVKEGSRSRPTFDSSELKEGSAVFMARFTAETWTGDLEKSEVDLVGLTKGNTIWSAKGQLDARSYAGRTIHLFDADQAGKLKPFAWDSLDTAQQATFVDALTRLCNLGTTCLPASVQNQIGGKALVDFLRGDRSNEGASTDTAKYFRQRASVLGDIVNSGPVYVQKPTKRYSDPGYGDFKEGKDGRTGMVYVGANDGMMHAFDAQTGAEAWAFVPSLVIDDLFWLADKGYATRHHFFVDGTPVVGDACVDHCDANGGSPEWKTLLVGGLNHGGQGYYALDITDPANPKGLWEFTHANLGYSYGNPVITKLANGQWVVMVTSGYNNVSGDGKGHLFILDAHTGALIRSISTDAGNAETPSGLAKIANFVNFPEYNNLTLRVYGGDLLGNLWRFDVNDVIPPAGYEAQRLATLKDKGNNAQPMTSAPQLGMIYNRHSVVFVGTGQLLGNPDLATTGIQSLYAIKDPLAVLDYGDPRTTSAGSFVEQVMSKGLCSAGNPYCEAGEPIIKVTKNAVDWATKDGWYVDFPVGGERVITDMDLRNSILSITTNTPQSGVCVPAGTSDLYYLDYQTGGYVREGADGMANFGHMDSMSSGPVPTYGPDTTIWQGCDGAGCLDGSIPPPPEISKKVRRISWRELIIE